MGFKITNGCGFHITFDNGYTISVQFGPGHYADNKNSDPNDFGDGDVSSQNAEVAIWDANHRWVTRRAVKEVFIDEISENVAGFLGAEDVGRLIEWCRLAPPVKKMNAEEELRELAQFIRDHPHAAQGMGNKLHGEWVTLQMMARRVLGDL